MFYWVTIMFSQTLGTALGDWTADSAGLGYAGSTVLFSSVGAVIGDFLDKPVDHGGLALSRYSASAALFAFMLACILIFPNRAAGKAH